MFDPKEVERFNRQYEKEAVKLGMRIGLLVWIYYVLAGVLGVAIGYFSSLLLVQYGIQVSGILLAVIFSIVALTLAYLLR